MSDEETKIDKEMKGVSDESALRKLLTSDEEEEENPEEKKEENGNKSDQEEQPSKEEEPQSSSTVKKKRKKEVLTPGKSGSGDAPIKEGNHCPLIYKSSILKLQIISIQDFWVLRNIVVWKEAWIFQIMNFSNHSLNISELS